MKYRTHVLDYARVRSSGGNTSFAISRTIARVVPSKKFRITLSILIIEYDIPVPSIWTTRRLASAHILRPCAAAAANNSFLNIRNFNVINHLIITYQLSYTTIVYYALVTFYEI